MTFDELKEFMKQVGWGALATSDGKTVGVRPMSGWAWFENELWCATWSKSDKVMQLEKNPFAEYCFCSTEGKHVRIAGNCQISNDNDEKMQLFKANPVLAQHIEDPASPEYVVIKMRTEKIRVMNTTDLAYTDIDLA